MKLKLVIVLFTVLISNVGYAQTNSYLFTKSWQNERVLVQQDSILIIGLGSQDLDNNYQNHRYVFTKIDVVSLQESVDTILFGGALRNSYHSAFSIVLDGYDLILSGTIEYMGNDTTYHHLSYFDFNNLELKKQIVGGFGVSNFVSSVCILDNKIYLLSSSQPKPLGPIITALKGYSHSLSQEVFSNVWDCSGIFANAGGCSLLDRQILSIGNASLLLVATLKANAVSYTGLQTGLIIKTDSVGNEQWRLSIDNDSTSCHNLLVAPLANGHYLATWQDAYYKPYKSPDNRQYPTTNKNVTGWFLEFDTSGNVIRKWKFRDVASARVTSPDILYFNHLITTKDSGIAITGNTRDYGTNGLDLGFLLKLDKYGNYQWYRQYEVNVAKPYTLGEEKLFLNGVTELSNGGFALAGEYRSDASDSFPDGAQKGVVLFVDEYGCMKPGCQLTDNVNDLQAKLNVFKVFPNPNVGVLDISSEKLDIRLRKIEIFDMQGRVVFVETPIGSATSLSCNISSLISNIYYLKIYRNDGYTETHKIIKQ